MKTSPGKDPGPLMYPGLPPLGTHPVKPRSQLSSRSSRSSGFDDSPDSREPSDIYSNQEVPLKSLKKQRKTRTRYSKQEKRLLEEYFSKCQYPSLEERMDLGQSIGMPEQQVQIWFKNQRAKYKRKNREGVPETSGSCKVVSGSTGSRGPLSVLASANGESMSPSTPSVGSTPNLNPCLGASLHSGQDWEGGRCNPKENLFDFQFSLAALRLGQPDTDEAPTDAAVAEGTAPAEIPFPVAPAAREPDDAQDPDPSVEVLWQRVLEDLDEFDELNDLA
ncbi:hypothetical protein STEG23_029558 [Scotinomys teguina]